MKKAAPLAFMSLFTSLGMAQSARDAAKPAQATKSSASPKKTQAEVAAEERRQKALDLLKRSRALNDQCDDGQKGLLLEFQIQTATKLDKNLALDWARELFDTGGQMEPRRGGYSQIRAAGALVKANPSEALSMLSRMEAAFLEPSPRELSGANMFNGTLATIFESYVKAKGKPGMIAVLSTADNLGDKRRYPYSAVLAAARSLNDPELATEIVMALITRFETGVDPPAVSYDFSQMLVQSEKFVPENLLKPAVDAATEALQKYPVNDNNKDMFMIAPVANRLVSVQGPVEIGLLKFMPMIKRVDPELANQLAKQYPKLIQPARTSENKSDNGISTTLGSGGNVARTGREGQSDEAPNSPNGHIGQDPDRGAKAMAAITDPWRRAEAYSEAAQQLAVIDPAKSLEFAEKANEAAALVDDSMTKFRALVAKLQADGSGEHREAVLQELEPTFRMAGQLMRKAIDDKDGTFEVVALLQDAVSTVAKVEPDLTVANIETIPLPYERATLLATAAISLASSLPMKSRAAPGK